MKAKVITLKEQSEVISEFPKLCKNLNDENLYVLFTGYETGFPIRNGNFSTELEGEWVSYYNTHEWEVLPYGTKIEITV